MIKTALIIVDMQNDYFPGGKWKLTNIETAAEKTSLILNHFRENSLPIIHVRHESLFPGAPFFTPGSEGAEIHKSLKPLDGEFEVLKHTPNGFKDTKLQNLLQSQGITNLVMAGAMSHMCIDAIIRASADLGYKNIVLHDACATCDLEFDGTTIPASLVHASFMAAAAFAYAEVIKTESLLARSELED